MPNNLNAAYERYTTHADEQTLTALFDAIRKYAESLARRYHPQEPDELGDQIVCHIWQRLGSFERRSSFKTWVHRIAVNYALDFLRRTKNERQTEGEDSLAHVAAPETHPERDVTRLANLTSDQQRIVAAIMRTGSYSDAASELGITTSAMRSHVHRIREKMSA